MAVRNVKPLTISTWRGLDTFASRNNVDEYVWVDANNILVNARGEAEVLRSPKAFGNSLIVDESCCASDSSPCSDEDMPIHSMCEFQRSAGNALIVDRGDETLALLEAGGEPTLVKVGNAEAAWTSLSINDTLQRVNGTEFIQIRSDFSVYRNGIDAPIGAPVLAYAANSGDTTAIVASIQGSYAYMNSVTGQVSSPSPLSNVLGPKSAGFDITFSVQASLQTGVDKVVFFLTLDGGEIPYLVIDAVSGDPVELPNTNGLKTIIQSSNIRDTFTPEPLYNDPPPTNATSMFEFKDRIFLIVDGGLRYSGFESCYIGVPHECWPVLNQLFVPGQNDKAIGGVGTQSGALIFGEKDCYLMTGFPSDKTSSPNNAIAVTEHLGPLKWNIGITYAETAVNTPFGVIWTDNTRRIRNWTQNGFPAEIGQAFRTELDAMTGPLQARWFQHGKNGGYYALTDGVNTLLLMLYMSPVDGSIQTGYGKSTTFAPDAIASVTFSNVEHFYFAKGDQVWEILNPTTAGDGWDEGTEIFFKMIVGNSLNFSAIHSMNLSGNLSGLTVTHAPTSEIDPEDVFLSSDLEADTGRMQYGVVDSPERAQHLMAFSFDIDDTNYRNIDSLTLNLQPKKRVI